MRKHWRKGKIYSTPRKKRCLSWKHSKYFTVYIASSSRSIKFAAFVMNSLQSYVQQKQKHVHCSSHNNLGTGLGKPFEEHQDLQWLQVIPEDVKENEVWGQVQKHKPAGLKQALWEVVSAIRASKRERSEFFRGAKKDWAEIHSEIGLSSQANLTQFTGQPPLG